KIIATILILFHHYQQLMGVQFEQINFYGGKNFYFGNIVELFFVISGIVSVPYITRIEQGETFEDFFRGRYLRFFPMLLISTISYTVLLVLFYYCFGGWFEGEQIDLFKVLVSAFGAQVIWGNATCVINNPMWYISVLLVCYNTLYFCIWFARRIHIKKEYMFVGVIVIGMMLIIRGIDWPIFCGRTGRGFVSFFSGILWEKYYYSKEKKKNGLAVGLVVATGLMFFGPLTGLAGGDTMIIFFGVAYFPALIGCLKTEQMDRILTGKMISEIAGVSFEAYIWHSGLYIVLLILLYTKGIAINLNSYGTMIMVVIMIEIFATVMYYLVEKPIYQWLKKDRQRKK
ncbi:MAG: acyltransferase, partial [Lachnospiraceae bacterium]|nr:acyltransferase [Lachnospiraceae bacterium]